MRGVYQVLHDGNAVRKSGTATAPDGERVLTEAEKELLRLLKARGVASICESISKEISYVWAVTSGFRTLANVGNFYFACAGQTFGYNPGFDFFSSGGMQLALFALHKFIHNEAVLVPVLESIHVYTKLHVDGAVDFLAVHDAKEILMKCVRFHDNKHNVITATCQALGSLVMNDLVKESISSSALTLELLGLLKRYGSSLSICRATLVPLGFLVTDAQITETFVDGNGIALVMTALKSFTKDTEVVWHGIGILNALNAKVLDPRLIYAIYGFTGIPRLVEALALHLDTEEIAVEGFQLLSRLAGLRETYRVVNQCKVLDLAYVALFAYSGQQHRHTRIEIKRTLHNFQKCTLYDPHELATREQASRRDVTLYALFVVVLLLTSALSAFGTSSNAMVTSLQRSVEQSIWTLQRPNTTEKHARRTLRHVSRVDDVWAYLTGPLHASLFASTWYNGDAFTADVDCQLGVVGRSNLLLGGVQLRMLRVQNATCGTGVTSLRCYPPYEVVHEARTPRERADGVVERWSAPDDSYSRAKSFTGHLATYPDTGYRVFLPRLSQTRTSDKDSGCTPLCQLSRLRDGQWIDGSSRALFVELNVYNAAEDLHAAVTLLFEFSATGGVLTSTQITPLFLNRYGGLFLLSLLFYAELLLLVGLAWHTHKQLDKILRYRLYYFTVPTHLVDFLTVVLWVAAIVMRLRFHVAGSHDQLTALAADNAFVNLNEIVFLVRQEQVLTAWCAMLMWWRLLRLARCLKPLEQTLEKFERAEDLIESYVMLLVIYALVFAQTGFFLFPSSSESFSTLGKSIASTAKSLLREWSASGQLNQVTVWGVLFRLCSVFVTLNLVVAILRERFDSRASAGKQKPSVEVPDGLSIVDLATRQLKASGMATTQASLPERLREAASHGLERLQDAARHAFAIPDDALELTELKKVWGLRSDDADGDTNQTEQRGVGFDTLKVLLENAEDEDRMLDERLTMLRARSEETLRCLQIVQRLREERKEARLARSNRLRGIRSSSSNATR